MDYDLILSNIAKHISLDKEETTHFLFAVRIPVGFKERADPKRRTDLQIHQLCQYRDIKGLLCG
jgi:hypothetical protein